jgi:hypothetical protein
LTCHRFEKAFWIACDGLVKLAVALLEPRRLAGIDRRFDCGLANLGSDGLGLLACRRTALELRAPPKEVPD